MKARQANLLELRWAVCEGVQPRMRERELLGWQTGPQGGKLSGLGQWKGTGPLGLVFSFFSFSFGGSFFSSNFFFSSSLAKSFTNILLPTKSNKNLIKSKNNIDYD